MEQLRKPHSVHLLAASPLVEHQPSQEDQLTTILQQTASPQVPPLQVPALEVQIQVRPKQWLALALAQTQILVHQRAPASVQTLVPPLNSAPILVHREVLAPARAPPLVKTLVPPPALARLSVCRKK